VIHAENGRLRLELPGRPDDRAVYSVSGALLQGFVDQVNGLRAERDQLRTALQGVLPLIDMGYFCECPTCKARPSPARTALFSARALAQGPIAAPEMHPTTRDLDRMEGPSVRP
jgi:hypothetical protein